MNLAALRNAIRESSGPVTGIELARRLDIAPGEVAAMLDALRASGQLSLDARQRAPLQECASSTSCSMSCPGPDDCALVIDISVTSLRIHGPERASAGTSV